MKEQTANRQIGKSACKSELTNGDGQTFNRILQMYSLKYYHTTDKHVYYGCAEGPVFVIVSVFVENPVFVFITLLILEN